MGRNPQETKERKRTPTAATAPRRTQMLSPPPLLSSAFFLAGPFPPQAEARRAGDR